MRATGEETETTLWEERDCGRLGLTLPTGSLSLEGARTLRESVSWQNGQEACDSEMPGIRCEAGQEESIKSEVTQLSPPQETHGAAR